MSFLVPKTGGIESPPDARDYDFASTELYGASPARRTIDTSDDGHIERDQFVGACTAYTLAQAVQDLDRKLVTLEIPMRVGRLNDDGSLMLDADRKLVLEPEPRVMTDVLPMLSPIFLYAGGRLMRFHDQGDSVPEPLPDTGSAYRYVIQFMRDVENGGGSRIDSLFPDVPPNGTRLPPAHVDQGDPLVKVGGYYRIHGEGRPDDLRAGIVAALEGYQRGQCSKPCTAMRITEGFVNTPEGEVYDGTNAGAEVGRHAMLVKGYDEPTDSVVLHQTWQNRPRTYRVRIATLATIGVGYETWVLKNLIRIPRVAA